MMIATIPWHITGLMGQPWRVAVFDYSDPFVARMAPLVIISVIGGAILLVSAIVLIVILVRTQLGERRLEAPLRYALAQEVGAFVRVSNTRTVRPHAKPKKSSFPA